MPSTARAELGTRLRDVERLVTVHGELTGSNAAGRKATHGPSITKAGVVLLAAAMEAFVEELFEEAGDLIFSDISADERMALYKQTSRRMNAATVDNTNMLFFNLGIPWVLSDVRWQKFSNPTFRKRLTQMIDRRGQIAHGKKHHVTLTQLNAWHGMVKKYAEVLESLVRAHVHQRTGQIPGW